MCFFNIPNLLAKNILSFLLCFLPTLIPISNNIPKFYILYFIKFRSLPFIPPYKKDAEGRNGNVSMTCLLYQEAKHTQTIFSDILGNRSFTFPWKGELLRRNLHETHAIKC